MKDNERRAGLICFTEFLSNAEEGSLGKIFPSLSAEAGAPLLGKTRDFSRLDYPPLNRYSYKTNAKMKTFLDFISEQEQKEITPVKGFAQFLTGEGWKPFVFGEDFTEPLIKKAKPKHRKKRTNNFSLTAKP